MLRQTRSMLKLNTAPKTDNSYAAYFNGYDSYIHIPIDAFLSHNTTQAYSWEMLGYYEGGYERPGKSDFVTGFRYSENGLQYTSNVNTTVGANSVRFGTAYGNSSCNKAYIDAYGHKNGTPYYAAILTVNDVPVNEWFRLIGRTYIQNGVKTYIWISKFVRSGNNIISATPYISNLADCTSSKATEFCYSDCFCIGGFMDREIQDSGNYKGFIKSFRLYHSLGTNEYLDNGLGFDAFPTGSKYPGRTLLDLDFSSGRMVNRSSVFNIHSDKIVQHNVSYRKHPEINL